MKTTIIVKFQIEGLHHWPKAAEIEPKVAFLAHPHRHIFYFTAEKKVTHSDRDVEIILFKRKILDTLENAYFDCNERIHDFGTRSCEQLAQEILTTFELESCECLEDNENGAKVYKS